MNRDEIKQYIPHREPMLLVDEIEVVDGIAHSKYQVRGDEFFLQGHYPGNPIVPGVIQCEIMAQSCSLLLKDELIGKTPLYAGIDNVRFKQQVKPGDLFEVEAKLTDKRGHLYFCEAKGLVGGKMVIKGSLSFALIPNEQ
ncbi:MAG: beta-hydroxyacyl-ACP dehydratase [Bacteroidales bacterium]|nr:beta-hydroxyacyl-ACP dehydratase [Bacteroidales bacterium]